MSTFYKTSTTWVVDFRYDGHPRRWYKLLPQGQDAHEPMTRLLHELYGRRAQLVEVRPATADEETQALRGEEPKNVLCPTGRQPRTEPCATNPGVSSNAARSTTPPAPDLFPSSVRRQPEPQA